MAHFIHTVKCVGAQCSQAVKKFAGKVNSLHCKVLLEYKAITITPAGKVLCTVGHWLWRAAEAYHFIHFMTWMLHLFW